MQMRAAVHPVLDDVLGGFSDLMSETLPGPLAALYEHTGTSIGAWSRIEVSWQPGRKVTVRYRVTGDGGTLDGQRDIVAVAGDMPPGALTVEGLDSTVAVWIVPDDPHLPGLSSAVDRKTVSRLLSGLGQDEEVRGCRLRSYRPGRRAVVQVDAGAASIFLKVVRPNRVETLHQRHRLLADHVPVPDSIGYDADLGVVALQAMPGSDLRRVLRGGPVDLPPADDIAGMIDVLPEPADRWRAASPLDSVPAVLELLSTLLPEEAGRLGELGDAITVDDSIRNVPSHGDFHEAQVVAAAGRPLGLIDIDGFGWGSATADPATMLGHLHLLASSTSDPGKTIGLARELNQIWDRRVDPVRLRLSVAAVVLGLATGPFRVQSPDWATETTERIEIAEQWVRSAERLDERSLTVISAASHRAVQRSPS